MIGFVRTTCSALFIYVALVVVVSPTNIGRPSTLVFAEQQNNIRNIQIDRELKPHSVYESKGSRLRERKQWFKIIEQAYSTSNNDKDSGRGTSKGMMNGKGGASKSSGKGKGGEMASKEMSGKGKGKGTKLPKFCRDFDFETDNGKGKGKSKSKDKAKGKGMSFGMGKGKGNYEKEGCRRNAYKKARRIPEISIFVGLLEQAGLEEILTCNGPFTVLAPSNAAFMNNSIVTEYLSNGANADELRDVLLYHILPGLGYIEDFRRGSVETLLFDANINVTINPLKFNNDAMIVEGDFKACNGVIHIIDDILLPPGMIGDET